MRWESARPIPTTSTWDFPRQTYVVAADLQESAIEMYNLLFGTTYYWKVVAKNRFGTSEGPVWKFTTGQIPEKPQAIYPKNGDVEVPVDVTLKWSSERAKEHDLYFGTTKLDMLGTLTDSQYTLPRLHFGTFYNWKVVSRSLVRSKVIRTRLGQKFQPSNSRTSSDKSRFEEIIDELM